MKKSKNVLCKICQSDVNPVFSGFILQKYNIIYYHCSHCGFLQTEEPYWLEEAYSSAVVDADTGILARSILFSHITSVLLFLFFNREERFLDYGGGYGIFTRLMRDIGFDFYWNDPFCKNIFARGFAFDPHAAGDEKSIFELVTCFEALEHFSQPIEEIGKIFAISSNCLVSTQLLPNVIPRQSDWWYYAPDYGQHISFYSFNTMEKIANIFNVKYYPINQSLHLFTPKILDENSLNIVRRPDYMSLFYQIRGKMKSRTVDDMNYIIQNQRNNILNP